MVRVRSCACSGSTSELNCKTGVDIPCQIGDYGPNEIRFKGDAYIGRSVCVSVRFKAE